MLDGWLLWASDFVVTLQRLLIHSHLYWTSVPDLSTPYRTSVPGLSTGPRFAEAFYLELYVYESL